MGCSLNLLKTESVKKLVDSSLTDCKLRWNDDVSYWRQRRTKSRVTAPVFTESLSVKSSVGPSPTHRSLVVAADLVTQKSSAGAITRKTCQAECRQKALLMADTAWVVADRVAGRVTVKPCLEPSPHSGKSLADVHRLCRCLWVPAALTARLPL